MPVTKEPHNKALDEKKLGPVPDVLRLSLPSWIFGTALLFFILGVFVFSPPTLPEYKQRILALTCALVGGIFAFFMTGDIGLRFVPTSSKLGKITIKATGGLAVFVLVLWWWTSPIAPIPITKEDVSKIVGKEIRTN